MMPKRVKSEIKNIERKVEEETREINGKAILYNNVEKIAENTKIVFKGETETYIAFGPLFRLRSIVNSEGDKEELYQIIDKKTGRSIIFRKRLGKFQDLKSILDDLKLIAVNPDANKQLLFIIILLELVLNMLSFYAMAMGFSVEEVFGKVGMAGLTGWLSAISLLLLLLWQRQNLLRAWSGAFFIDRITSDTVTIARINKFLFWEKIEHVNTKADIIDVSLLYTNKANSKELRGFSLQDVADRIDENLRSERDHWKKERDALLTRVKELTIENIKLRRENDELAGKAALMYSLGSADMSIPIGSIEKKESNLEFWKEIIKWIIIATTLISLVYLASNSGVSLGTGGILAGGALVLVIILILIIIAVNAVRRF